MNVKILFVFVWTLALSTWAGDSQQPILPTFPLKSKTFDLIDDAHQNISQNFDRKRGEMEIDLVPMEVVLNAVSASSQEHLIKSVNPGVTFKLLMHNETSLKYRGEVVKMTGELIVFEECALSLNSLGLVKIWKGQIVSTDGKIISFRSLEPLPKNVKIGQSVQLIGIFMQRYSYLNRQPGEMLTLTPLLYVRRIESSSEFKKDDIDKQAATSEANAQSPKEPEPEEPEKGAIEKKVLADTEGRIVVQLKYIEGGKYKAMIDNNSFDLVAGGINKTLNKYLTEQIEGRLKKCGIIDSSIANDDILCITQIGNRNSFCAYINHTGLNKEDAKGGIPIPVKLRIQHDTPMKVVESIVLDLAKVNLVNIHYTLLQEEK